MNKGTDTAGWPYEDIVDLPHHVSVKHRPMPMIKRAAQFAPFAALTGYEDAVAEAGRLTEDMMDLSEERINELNRKLKEALAEDREIHIVFFVPDEKKAGGSYEEASGKIRKYEMNQIVLENGTRIPSGYVVDIG